MVEEEESLRPNMCALAILSCRPNSHPFQERHISLHEPIKVGRSVARARPTASNGIFDCKVLSRHHAMLWYESEKFYIQDTKSSNGTFINNQRLCKSGEESPLREIYSGDLIQFGVEVMENNRRGEKITHGCIIGTIALYHPDGREAKPAPFLNQPNQPGITIQSQDLYQLAHYLQEALHREKMLEQKLGSLQQLVVTTQEAAEGGWQALIDEDKLLSRLEMLENQLHVYSKNHSEDTLRQELVALQEDKISYETTAKESLRRVLQEKLDAVTKLSDLERSLTSAEDECGHLKDMCESSQEELKQLAIRYQDQLKEVQELQDKLQEAEKSHQEEMERAEREKQELTEKLEDMIQQESSLSAQIESLQADNDFAKEQLAAMKAKLESIKEINQEEDKETSQEDDKETNQEADKETNQEADKETNQEVDKESNQDEDKEINQDEDKEINQEDKTKQEEEKTLALGLEGISSEDIIPLGDKDSVPENLEEKLKELQKQIEVYKEELEVAQMDSNKYLARITSLEEKVSLSDMHMNQMMENALDSLKLQLKESQKQSDSSEDLIKSLEDHIQQLENEVTQQTAIERVRALGSATEHSVDNIDDTMCESDTDSIATLNGHSVDTLPVQDSNLLASVSSTTSSLSDLTDGNDIVSEAREAQRKAEAELQKYRDEMKESSQQLHKSSMELEEVKGHCFQAQQLAKQRGDLVSDLQDQLRKAESATKEVKQQILELLDRLLEEQEQSSLSHKALDTISSELEKERGKHSQTTKDLEETRSQLQVAQQAAKQSHNEAEQLKNKAKVLQEELDSERKERHPSPRNTHGDSPYSQRSSNRSKAEFLALKEECSNLRKRIQAIEAEMKMSRKENLQLSSEYNKLQESYKHLEALKEKLASSEVAWRMNLTDAQKDAEKSKQEVRDTSPGSSSSSSSPATSRVAGAASSGRKALLPSAARTEQLKDQGDEVSRLRSQCQQYSHQLTSLRAQVETMETDYRTLSDRSKKLSFMSSVPLLMLLFAVLLVLYPTLEQLTATSS
ncbi:sarcolemmal membrane-associated protein-like isoform X4 [Littorina saxatilis]|uniref:sarcolemmal membrane-associated protein-like isoform X4 n=1 Tax=Littorina saxatilis TaxID=31220 RepID=UPI0038B596C7